MSSESTFNHTAPFIRVFGSATRKVTPDVAALNVTVFRIEPEPAAAFQQTREAAQQVRAFLAGANFDEVGSSRVSLNQEFEQRNTERKFVGYRASVQFNIVLRDLSRLEELLVGVIENGANTISSPNFQTSRLKEIRAEVRQEALVAARTKAELYCAAAGGKPGKVLYIVDENPDQLRMMAGLHTSHDLGALAEAIRAFDPSSITVGGAVTVCFEIIHP